MLIGHVVTRNEADRWLDLTLERLATQCDVVAVFDDRSTDATVRIASRHAIVGQRRFGTPAFLEHEAQFRQAAWEWMLSATEARDGDVVLAVDADEIVVGDVDALVDELDRSLELRAGALIREVFDLHDGVPQERVDGHWGQVDGVRIARVLMGADTSFGSRRLGCGSVPGSAPGSSRAVPITPQVEIQHLGYILATDRVAKYRRYVGTQAAASDHIASILTPPRLRPLPVVGGIDRWFWDRVADRLGVEA